MLRLLNTFKDEVIAKLFLQQSHSHHVIYCGQQSLNPSLKDTLAESALSKGCITQQLHQTSWSEIFLRCNCRIIISVYSVLVCDDDREEGSSEGQAWGDIEADQEFQSRTF